ncbi:MAG: NAD(P)-binding domain-containing protein [Alphaproteobacteria bacterium]|nr:NAD(P)-binding domain-containing protein [Alphaproteobacteria bacterium]
MARPDILKVSFEFSPKLGIRELPRLKPSHESNVPGLYVVGDLADAPIIKVALRQGYEVAGAVADGLGASDDDPALMDVLVVGAGPAGIGAALALSERGARYVQLEKERPFATIQNFPRSKIIFSEPREMESPGNLWFEDATTETLVEKWDAALAEKRLPIRQPEALEDLAREGGVFVATTRCGDTDEVRTIRARRVILATGRRGAVRRLDVPGESLDKVRYTLRDPAEHAGRRLLVVGGGDSAVETAVDCADAGAEVTLAYRGAEFSRPKAKNKARLEAALQEGRVRAELGAVPVEIQEDRVALQRGEDTFELPNDDVIVQIGTTLPYGFLRRLGIKMAGQMDALRATWILSFAALTYCFYVLKHKKGFFPFGEGDVLGFVPGLLEVDLGFRTVDASFWGTVVYSALILGFGIRAYRKYPLAEQKRRYLSLIGFQWVFLFGVPELLAPLIIERPWKVYALTVPWPLSIWSLVDAPGWTPDGSTATALGWLGVGALASFVLIPLYVRYNGERFCSYMCGCGGLAETLGDLWRHLAPRGATSYKAEWAGRVIFFLAIPVTGLILMDAWGFIAGGALYDTKAFAQSWYGLVVDFWLASVVGVAMYPYLGNRVWCRFFCPLRAYMEMLSKRISKIAIVSNSKCIGCGECTRFCQMGIDVQGFAQREQDFHNGNSACIQCGICIQVCPMEVLSIGARGEAVRVAV